MPCCGQKREEWNAAPSQSTFFAPPSSTVPATPPPALPAAIGSSVTLLSRQGVTTITGKVTGKRYRFQGTGAMQAVDRRDADAMIATGAFEQVWG